MAVSYRRNRKIQFKWMYELNEDPYKCYMKAKNNPKKRNEKFMGQNTPGIDLIFS